jgi:hypothetical protein
MHHGSIERNTKARHVYEVLRANEGQWVDGWTLTNLARVTAVGTRVSEVRRQLPADESIEHMDTMNGQRGSWYRLVKVAAAA